MAPQIFRHNGDIAVALDLGGIPMRILSKGRLISLVLLCSVSLLSAGCFFDKLEPATLSLIDEAEAVWLDSPMPSTA